MQNKNSYITTRIFKFAVTNADLTASMPLLESIHEANRKSVMIYKI